MYRIPTKPGDGRPAESFEIDTYKMSAASKPRTKNLVRQGQWIERQSTSNRRHGQTGAIPPNPLRANSPLPKTRTVKDSSTQTYLGTMH